AIARATSHNPSLAWLIGTGMRTYGGANPSEYMELMPQYRLTGSIAEHIEGPVLVFDAANDDIAAGQPDQLAKHLTAAHNVIRMRTQDGAGEHCNAGSLHRFHAALFDWLQRTLATSAAASVTGRHC